jgi:hypothetical protein
MRTSILTECLNPYLEYGRPEREDPMPKYLIERELPGAGKLSADELHDISAKSNKVIAELGPEIRWLTSYVTEDKIYCVYSAPDEDILYEHARCGGFPADRISKVSAVIDPTTGD